MRFGIACGLWLVARIGFLAGGDEGFWVAAAAELGFFVFAAVAMMRAWCIARGRPQLRGAVAHRHLAGCRRVAYLPPARGGDYALLMQRLDVGLLVMAR